MLEELRIRNYSDATQLDYVGAVARFARHLATAPDLLGPDYVEILCGSLDQLDHAFAEIDADKRRSALAAEHSSPPPSRSATPEIASASLPKEDRRLVRAEATGNRILAATRSRAPRVNAGRTRRPQRGKLDYANRILTP